MSLEGPLKQRSFVELSFSPNRKTEADGSGRDFGRKDRRSLRRFPIHTALRYRAVGEGQWHTGTTQNISASGVLFETDRLLELRSKVELSFESSLGTVGGLSAQVFARGVIVRVTWEPRTPGAAALAAELSKYRIVRGGRNSRHLNEL